MANRLAVIFGSRSCEHDVSVISGLQALAAAGRHDAFPVYIAGDGAWYVGAALRDISFIRSFDPAKAVRVIPFGEGGKLMLYRHPGGRKLMLGGLKPEAIADVAMPVLHGMNGEDGTIQGMLELWDVPYTSSGLLGSAVGMDKIAMKQFFRGCGFPVLPDTWIDRADWAARRDSQIEKVEAALHYPVYVKPANLGSSIGISRADDRDGLIRAVDVACAYDRRILVERGVERLKEVNCSVMGYGSDVRASALEMPVKWDDKALLDFGDKYGRGGKGEGGKGMASLGRVIPAPIDEGKAEALRALSVEVFKALDSKGVVRIDYILDESDGSHYIGEINTIPGSLAFYLWEPVGVSFAELVDRM
ncbi:MAG: D-alanine--D-alanine ligase, partial [Clostridiales bacterium]|nr:D-alanine--D-alanine ligase [Clostridiales bacterium]